MGREGGREGGRERGRRRRHIHIQSLYILESSDVEGRTTCGGLLVIRGLRRGEGEGACVVACAMSSPSPLSSTISTYSPLSLVPEATVGREIKRNITSS